MRQDQVADLSDQLKNIAKDLSFLGHPRYPLQQLGLIFPQHKNFIHELEDTSISFGVDVKAKRLAIDQFLKNLQVAEIGQDIKFIFTRRAEDYMTLLSMLENFHSPFFYDYCAKLYGTSTVSTQDNSFHQFLEKIPDFCVPDKGEKNLKGEEAMAYLKKRLLETFSESHIEVRPSTSLLSDSSAGRRTLKLNPNKFYSIQQLDIFLVHEGWVHLGTSLNGAQQTHHPWLGTWAPRTTFLQEGLAVLTEIITGTMTKERWSKVLLRHLSTSMAEKGSNIQDVYAFLCHQGIEELDAFKMALRVFRGVPLEGGMAFTKELLYLHGMVQLLYHLKFYQTDLRTLWVGKMSFEEHLVLVNTSNVLPFTTHYYPKGLEDPVVLDRLQKLQDLCARYFKTGFL